MDLFTFTFKDNYNSTLDFHENIGTPDLPAFSNNPIENPFGFTLESNLNELLWNFDLADMDSDGDLDLLLGAYVYDGITYEGTFFYYENTGTAQSPAFASPVEDPFGIGTLNTVALLNFVDQIFIDHFPKDIVNDERSFFLKICKYNV